MIAKFIDVLAKENTIFTALLDIFFPRFCLGCHTYGMWLCQECERTLPRYLPRTSPLPDYSANLSVIRAVYSYDHRLTRSIVHTCKYEGVRELVSVMALAIAGEYQYIPFTDHETVIIPVPLHECKLRERGFNQAELLAQQVASLIGRTVSIEAVRRIKNTRTQVTLPRKQRRDNVRGAFVCDKTELVAGKKIVLIDDVSTTGSTLSELAGVLRRAGAVDVSALVFAHGMLLTAEDRVPRADRPMESLYA